MSLPSDFKTAEEYFYETVNFLNEFQWIFRNSNTQFIADGTIKDIPPEWIDCFLNMSLQEINCLPLGCINETWPDSLKTFLATSRRLSPRYTENFNDSADIKSIKGVSPKKLHEIENLSKRIHSIHDDSLLIDLGSGLGYLSQYLNQKYMYQVIGFESDQERVEAATKRQSLLFPESKSSVHYHQHFVTENSATFLHDVAGDRRMGIIGLHACADLTVTAIKLFLNTKAVQNLIIMPCCYHKLSQNSDGSFKNIPLSQMFRNTVEICMGFKRVLNRPFLRLACQQTAARWSRQTEDEHADHGKQMFQRAVVEALTTEFEAVVVEKKSQIHADQDFNYIEKVLCKYKLINKETKAQVTWNEVHSKKIRDICEEFPNGSSLAELLTGLQAVIQSICENIVLLDRVSFIKEMSENLSIPVKVSVEKIINDATSPRCFALICEKKLIP